MPRVSGRTSTIVKSRFVRPGSSRTMPAAYRGRAGGGARRQIGAALRYIQTRPLGPHECADDRVLFMAHANTVARWDARDELARWVTPGVAYHSLVLSPGSLGEGMTLVQMRDWTHRVMADLEGKWGGPASWYAAVHHHTDHVHAHVIVAASRAGGAGGVQRGTRFSREDFQMMRESGDYWAERERRTMHLWQQVEWYAADLARTALVPLLPHVGGGDPGGSGRRLTERDESERSLWPRR